MNNNRKLSTKAYNILKKEIILLERKPGSILYESTLSEELNISRTPMRNALQQLTSKGLVTIKTGNKNYFYVSTLDFNSFQDLCQVRNVLEGLSVELASMKYDDSEITQLQNLITSQSSMLDNDSANISTSKDLKTAMNIDRIFHKTIAKSSKNSYLIKQLENIIDLYYRYNFYAIENGFSSFSTISEHQSIVDSIKNRKSEQAKLLMEKHLATSNQYILFSLIGDTSLPPLKS